MPQFDFSEYTHVELAVLRCEQERQVEVWLKLGDKAQVVIEQDMLDQIYDEEERRQAPA